TGEQRYTAAARSALITIRYDLAWQQALKLVWLDQMDHLFHRLRHDLTDDGCVLQRAVVHQLLAKGPNRAGIGLRCVSRPQLASGCRLLTKKCQPTLHVGLRDLINEEALVRTLEILLEQTQGCLMPFQRFWLSLTPFLLLKIVPYRSLDDYFCASLLRAGPLCREASGLTCLRP